MDDATRRSLALFPIGIVQKLTDLTARQIRYYEQHELIHPVRTEGNQRLFSFNDVERLLEIKNFIDKGLNIAGIKAVMNNTPHPDDMTVEHLERSEEALAELNQHDLHELLMQELSARTGHPGGPESLMQGELARFFRKER